MELIDEAVENGARREKACGVLGITIRTAQRWRSAGSDMVEEDKRKNTPHPNTPNRLSQEEEEEIIKVVTSKEYTDKSPCQIVPELADKGIYLASESTIYRILRKREMQKHRSRSRKPTAKKPEPCVATAPNQVWSWDITYLKTIICGVYFYLYMFLDIYSRKIVGWEVYSEEKDDLSARLLQKIYIMEKVQGKPLVLHSDNGGPMRGRNMISMMEWLGIIPSRSRPHVSDDNPYSESLFKTLKYRPEFPKGGVFKDIESARIWVSGFVDWYNTRHHHSAIKFLTPDEVHRGLAGEKITNRDAVYKEAYARHPERWSGKTRNWAIKEVVFLNPPKCKTTTEEKATNAA